MSDEEQAFTERLVYADRILESVAHLEPRVLRVVARALVIDGGPLSTFGDSLDCFADVLQDGGSTSPLARIKLARDLRLLDRDDSQREALLQRLEDADEPPWPALREALLATGAS